MSGATSKKAQPAAQHNLTIVFGVLLVVMLDGFFFVLRGFWAPLDRVFQAVVSLLCLALLAHFAIPVSRRTPDETGSY